jgi:hypothetical protein
MTQLMDRNFVVGFILLHLKPETVRPDNQGLSTNRITGYQRVKPVNLFLSCWLNLTQQRAKFNDFFNRISKISFKFTISSTGTLMTIIFITINLAIGV